MDLDDVPLGAQLLPCRFIYVTKRSGEHKSRLVAGGHVQATSTFGDYNGSPTLNMVSLTTFLVNAVQRQLTAYLNADLPTPIYLGPSEGMKYVLTEKGKDGIIKLKKSLYGLKEAGLLWFQLLKKTLEEEEFISGAYELCIFTHRSKDIYIMIYVDDCIIAGKEADVKWIIETLRAEFTLKETE